MLFAWNRWDVLNVSMARFVRASSAPDPLFDSGVD
jgi:hypothetical protein